MVYIPKQMQFLLWPVSLLNRLVCQINNFLYTRKIHTSRAASIPVISIGNLDFGGSGKTPLAMHLIARLQQKGFRPALISRGYRGKWEHRQEILSDGKKLLGSWQDSGDEPFMIAQNLPTAGVFIGKDRFASVETAAQMGFDIAVLDDGFQHRRLHRDIDIVLYDPTEKIRLRESSSALKRCQIILVQENQKNRIAHLSTKYPQAGFFLYKVVSCGLYSLHHNESIAAADLQSKRILGFSGIAKPRRFYKSLKMLGLNPIDLIRFPDHYSFPPKSIKKILGRYKHCQADVMVITEKDKVKLMEKTELNSFPIYYLKIDLEIAPRFYENIWELLASKEV